MLKLLAFLLSTTAHAQSFPGICANGGFVVAVSGLWQCSTVAGVLTQVGSFTHTLDNTDTTNTAQALIVGSNMSSNQAQFTSTIVANVPTPTGSLVSYEKGGLIIHAETTDPSNLGVTSLGMVALDSRGVIAQINPTGNAWSANFNPAIVSQAVSGAVNNGSGLCRITVPLNHGFVNGNSLVTHDIGGATCNGSFTVSNAAATTIDLTGSTFGGAYTSGGFAGGDGYLNGLEIDVFNGGTTQNNPLAANPKFAFQAASFGPNAATAGLFITRSGSNTFAEGIYAVSGSITAHFLNYPSAFVVSNTGQTTISDTTDGAAGVAGSIVTSGGAYITKQLYVNNLIHAIGSGGGFEVDRRDTNASAFTLYSPSGTLNFFDAGGGVDKLIVTSAGGLQILNAGSVSGGDEGQGTINVAGGYWINGVAGATCSAGTVVLATFTVTKGIVTHC